MDASDPRMAEATLPSHDYVERRDTGDWLIEQAANELDEVVQTTAARLIHVDAAAAATRPAPGKWSVKEIVGHLIDSAANNHQRFVRAQYEDPLVLPGYAQDFWVAAQGYADAAWPDLIELWRLYNHRLADVIRLIPQDRLDVECRIGPYKPEPLGFLVEDYVGHLKHHMRQIDGVLATV